jgi:hypothetical protein
MKLKVPQARPFIHGLAAGGEKMFRAPVMGGAGGAQLTRALTTQPLLPPSLVVLVGERKWR